MDSPYVLYGTPVHIVPVSTYTRSVRKVWWLCILNPFSMYDKVQEDICTVDIGQVIQTKDGYFMRQETWNVLDKLMKNQDK